jgi:hypothetical protein
MIRFPTGQLTVAVWSRALLYAVPPILICHPAMGLAQIANACTLKSILECQFFDTLDEDVGPLLVRSDLLERHPAGGSADDSSCADHFRAGRAGCCASLTHAPSRRQRLVGRESPLRCTTCNSSSGRLCPQMATPEVPQSCG